MLDPLLTPSVEETIRQPRQQIQALVGLAQQQGATIGTDRAPIKPGHDLTLPTGFKSEAGLVTICHSRGRSLFVLKHLLVEVFRLDWTAFGYITREISGLTPGGSPAAGSKACPTPARQTGRGRMHNCSGLLRKREVLF